jgi:hypothetical protein
MEGGRVQEEENIDEPFERSVLGDWLKVKKTEVGAESRSTLRETG